MDKRRSKILLIMSVIIILFSIYVLTFDPLIALIGFAVGLVTLFNSYQALKGVVPKFIQKGEQRENKKIQEEVEKESMYTRQRRLNNEKYQKKREEEEKEQKFNL